MVFQRIPHKFESVLEPARVEIHELDIVSINPARFLKRTVCEYGFNGSAVENCKVFHECHFTKYKPVVEVEVAVEQTNILLHDELVAAFIESLIHTEFVRGKNISYLYV